MSFGIPLFISRKKMDLKILLIYFMAINIITFIAYARDKRLAKKPNARRIPEKTLLLLAAIGGSIGALIAMYTLRHKTLHKKFFLGVPAILLAQIALVVYLCLKISH
jgi:Predicted membrane protein